MKRALPLLLTSLIFPLFLAAQPVITKDWVGKPGDMIVSSETNERPDVTPKGANVTWDFSMLTAVDSTTFVQHFANPDTTPFIGDYPAANSCFYASYVDSEAGLLQAYGYSTIEDSKWELVANVITANGGMITENYTDPRVYVPFPLEYEQGASDFYGGERDLIVAQTQFAGLSIYFGDAWGTVIMPDATFDNCMRMEVITTQTDTTDLGLGIIEEIHLETTTYMWLSLEHPGPLATYEESESYQVAILPPLPNDTSDITRDTTMTWDPSAVNSSVSYFSASAFDLSIAPTIFTNQLTAEFNLEAPERIRLELFNLTGQQVFGTTMDGNSGTNRTTLSLPDLPTGQYIAMMRGKKQGAVVKLVKAE